VEKIIILTDSTFRETLFPFTHTRHTADIRVGILTIREKWEHLTDRKINSSSGPLIDNSILIPANIIPSQHNFEKLIHNAENNIETKSTDDIRIIQHPSDIFLLNDICLRQDFDLLTYNKISQKISDTNKAIQAENIFIEPDAIVEHSFLNASTGPVYISKNAVVMEGNMIRGPFFLGRNSILKMGSKVYGATTIGPNCVAGGEIKNSVIFGNSNKAHDGYLGDSVIGEWCNLGAGTSNSNVKNTGGQVGYIEKTQSQPYYSGAKGGLLMGDYSRAAINTSFNTGTVIGVCCNIFGEKMPAKYLENFTWGEDIYLFEKVITDIDNWKKMKGEKITENEIEILKKLYYS
jgi:UDP-N-acetylglucosamine diphosphorylase / glucose-1-phosphate thymidylyltransferase / UDP-N-acetylgalactosamine diphosphorylase / glucosamine-1-phosphate N-acetyltransferase / galactosamine-1-phosphate N-acetyltransferase